MDVRRNLASPIQLGNRARKERPVRVGGRLGARKATNMHGGDEMGISPLNVIKIYLLPVVWQTTGVEHFQWNPTRNMTRRFGLPGDIPGIRFGGFPAFIADNPAKITKIGFKDHHAAFA